MILAGDVGGTKTDLALYTDEALPVLVREATYSSTAYRSLSEVLRAFLGGKEKVSAAAFGIPGPIIDERVVTTNLPWKIVQIEDVVEELGGAKVRLMNDLETTAQGALHLPVDQLKALQPGIARRGNRAVIAAGTGLGQAFLHWNGARHTPSATEGGHTDFAPLDEREDAMLRFLRRKFGGRVSYERVLSGPGLFNIFDFLDRDQKRPVDSAIRTALAETADPSAVIGQAGVAGTCPTCVEALEIFVRIYGAQAGNLALTVMATGGVYLGGGIVGKILPKIAAGGFMDGFLAKGRYRSLMSEIPVWAILNPSASRIGAAMAARDLLIDPK